MENCYYFLKKANNLYSYLLTESLFEIATDSVGFQIQNKLYDGNMANLKLFFFIGNNACEL